MHAEELSESENDSSVPWENGEGHEYQVQEESRQQEDGDLRVALFIVSAC